jgi:2-keto-3-deoxy-L-rhamnonate aldolase RhmA
LRNREHLLGTFIKTPTTHTTEIIGSIGYDFVIVDQEHSPFDRTTIDLISLAARANNIAALVRVAEPTPASILTVLDVGCTGVLVPHVDSPAKAKEIAAACRYRTGNRGYSPTNRGGNWGGNSMKVQMDTHDARVTCVAMIEDPHAVDHIDEIAATPGIDAFFIGRGDITATLKADSKKSPETVAIVEKVAAAAKKANMPVIVLPSDRADATDMAKLGATAFIISNDQNFLKKAAMDAMKTFAAPIL